MPTNPINTAFLENEKMIWDFDKFLNNEKTIAEYTQRECLQGLTDYSDYALVSA